MNEKGTGVEIEGEMIETQEEEAQPLTSAKTPQMPTLSQLREHRETHIPYRCWCEECVEGFGKEAPHLKKNQGKRTIPLISCDYLFVTSRGTFLRKEYTPIEGEESLKVLVVYCSSTKCIFAHAVPQKGVDEDGYCVEQMVNDIAWLGHARIVIRSDNEPAIARLVLEALKALKVEGIEQAAAEGSIPHDPQSNGAAEAAVRVFKGMLRTLQLSLERELRARVPVGHPVMT